MLEAFMEVVVRFVMLRWQTECVAGAKEVACAVHFSPARHFSFQGNGVNWSTNSIKRMWKWICHECWTLLILIIITEVCVY